ncbi:MAG TPA: hypothetical protein VLQ45_10780 [Thermoanaerobaculia bacterium]|nr:hypothetical protein [Thermoanaerobaculia bacterium]
MKRDAAWLVRRYRDGGAPDWKVKAVLEREFNRLINERYELRGEMDELRRSVPERLQSFDEATDRALQWKAERRFGDALREIRRAAAELSELRRFVSVGADLARASGAVEEIESLLADGLIGLTTPRVLRRLRDVARKLLDQSEARKAKFVVLLLKSQADGLRSRERREPPSGLTLLLGELEPRGGAEAVEGLRKLIREGYLHLAERLAEDLDSELAVKDRTRRASETQGGSLGPLLQDMQEIRQRADLASRSLASWLKGAAPTDII